MLGEGAAECGYRVEAGLFGYFLLREAAPAVGEQLLRMGEPEGVDIVVE